MISPYDFFKNKKDQFNVEPCEPRKTKNRKPVGLNEINKKLKDLMEAFKDGKGR